MLINHYKEQIHLLYLIHLRISTYLKIYTDNNYAFNVNSVNEQVEKINISVVRFQYLYHITYNEDIHHKLNNYFIAGFASSVQLQVIKKEVAEFRSIAETILKKMHKAPEFKFCISNLIVLYAELISILILKEMNLKNNLKVVYKKSKARKPMLAL